MIWAKNILCDQATSMEVGQLAIKTTFQRQVKPQKTGRYIAGRK